MNRRIVLLNLALLGLAGLLVWMLRTHWLEAQARERTVLQRKIPPKTVLAPPTPPAVKASSPAEYIDVASKMLFSKDRNPTIVVEPPKPAPEPVMPALPNYHGQMAIGEPVILLSAGNGAQSSLHAGDRIGDFTVLGFDADNIRFDWKGKTVERKLDALRPKQTVAQASPGGAPAPTSSPTAPPAPVRAVASLDRPNAAPAAPAPNASPTTGKAVTALGGSSTASNSNNNSDGETGGDEVFGPLLPGGGRPCVASDNSPAGTVHSGYKKNQYVSILGEVCRWEQVK